MVNNKSSYNYRSREMNEKVYLASCLLLKNWAKLNLAATAAEFFDESNGNGQTGFWQNEFVRSVVGIKECCWRNEDAEDIVL